MKERLIKERLFEAVNAYSMREFDTDMYKRVEDIPQVLAIAYTTTEDNEHEVQINFDLSDLSWKEYIDNVLWRVERRTTLQDFIDEIEYASFDEIVSDTLYDAENMYEEEEEEQEPFEDDRNMIVKFNKGERRSRK